MPPRLLRPPGAPPGMPPPGLLPPGTGPNPGLNPNVLSAPPSISRPPQKVGGRIDEPEVDKKSTATIEAKPMIKKLGDVTKFAPTAVKVRRQVKDARGRILRQGGGEGRISSFIGSYFNSCKHRIQALDFKVLFPVEIAGLYIPDQLFLILFIVLKHIRLPYNAAS